MYLPTDVYFKLNEKLGLNWEKDQELIEEWINDLSTTDDETPESFAHSVINLTDVIVSRATGIDVII